MTGNCGLNSKSNGIIVLLRLVGSNVRDVDISTIDFANAVKKPPKKVVLPFGFEKLENIEENDPLLGQARRYVKKRGITLRQLHEHEIGATVADDLYRYRIIFPVRREGKLVGLVARDWTGKSEKKFLNSDNTRSLYNADPKKYGTKMAILSEGVVKALAIERAFRYKVCSAATLGATITDPQVNQLTDFKEVVLFSDPDRVGLKGFLGVANNLQSMVEKVSFAWPLPDRQADDMSEEEIVEAVNGRREFNTLLHLRLQTEVLNRG